MVCVVVGVLEIYDLKQTDVHNQKLVCIGLHLPASAENSTSPPISFPWIAFQEEMISHVLNDCIFGVHFNIFTLRVPLRICQVRFEVTGHQKRHPLGTLDDVCNNDIYGKCIVRGNVITHGI